MDAPEKSYQAADPGPELTLAEEAYSVLTEEIVSLVLPPGAIVSEWSLSQRLGIGRTPIREATKQLVRDHLVTLVARRGIIISEINEFDMLLMLELRRALEPLRYARAAGRANTADLKLLEGLADELEAAAEQLDLRTHSRVDKKFDSLVDRCAKNPYLTNAVLPLHNHVRRYWNAQVDNGGFARVASLHVALVRSVATADSEASKAACLAMLDFNAEFFERQSGWRLD